MALLKGEINMNTMYHVNTKKFKHKEFEQIECSISTIQGKTISLGRLYNWSIDNFDWMLLADLDTDKDYRNKGLGTFIINQAYEYATSKKKGLYLAVSLSNTNAIKLYEKLGFKKISFIQDKYSKYCIMGKTDLENKADKYNQLKEKVK